MTIVVSYALDGGSSVDASFLTRSSALQVISHPSQPYFINRWTNSATFIATFGGLLPLRDASPTLVGICAGLGMVYALLATWGMWYVERCQTGRGMVLCLSLMALLAALVLSISEARAGMLAMPLLSQLVLFAPSAWALTAAGTLVAAVPALWDSGGVTQAAAATGGMAASVAFVYGFSIIAKRELTWRVRAESLNERLRVANRALLDSAAQVAKMSAREERLRIARDVHDALGHYLTAVHVQLEAAKASLDAASGQAGTDIDRAQHAARKGLEEIRNVVSLLRSPSPPFVEVLGALVRAYPVESLAVKFVVTGESRGLPDSVEQALLRVVQEALTNVRRHAQAAHACVLLQFRDESVVLQVTDDGPGEGPVAPGSGLRGIQERIAELGGKVEHRLLQPRGFSLDVVVPS